MTRMITMDIDRKQLFASYVLMFILIILSGRFFRIVQV